MRETQMKKIIATAVAAAFAAPVMAADVTVSGSVEFNMNDANGTTTSATDSAFKVAASTETANGIGVSGAIKFRRMAARLMLLSQVMVVTLLR
jgi:opacity protein-like surface antigen